MNDTIETYDHCGLTIEISYDMDAESPADWGNFQIVTFDCDLMTDGDKADYFTDNDKLTPAVQAKLKAGKMFGFDYYSHGPQSAYKLTGDLNNPDGFIVFNDAYIKDTTYAERMDYAKGDLEAYTRWANGEVYGYTISDANGDTLDSLWGMDDLDYCQTGANNQAEAIATSRQYTAKPASSYFI